MKTDTALRIAFAFVCAKIILLLLTAESLGFHRDEFLYLALGRHLDWGYWSNPPFIGLVGWLSQHMFGGSLWAARLFPALCSGGLVWLSALMVRDLGGGRFAQVLSGVAAFCSVAWMRAFSMLQPVPFDIFFWALASYGVLRWLKTKDKRWWWFVGAVAGVGFLNKYTILFWAAALFVALLLTPQRRILATRWPWLGALIALALAAPNLFWQLRHRFPVVEHMRDLSAYQLENVQPLNFLLDQLILHGPTLLLWLPGLFFLLHAAAMRPYRVLGWCFVATLVLFLVLHGKSYYTLGAYPVLFAAGAVFWETYLRRFAAKAALVIVMVLLSLPLAPTALPILPVERLASYFRWLTQDVGIEAAVRWETGKLEALPQDYADMLGWPELAALVDTALAQAGDPRQCLVYGENYGEAGAVEHLSRSGLSVASFSDSYRLWAPDTLAQQVNTLVYVNDEPGEDVRALFADIRKIGAITHPFARERGTGVYLCRQPRSSLPAAWKAIALQEKKGLGPR